MRRFLITGASSGLGLSVARALVAHDTQLALLGRDAAKLDKLADVAHYRLPLNFLTAAPAEVTVLVEQMGKDVGGFDGIFHAAGLELVKPLRMMLDGDYHAATMAADSAFGILRACAAAGVMKKESSVVLMSSVAAHRGTPGMVAYSAGKAAIEAMTRAAAAELAIRHIRVNAVAAGAFNSPMHERITRRMPQESKDAYATSHPLGIGDVDAVRDCVLHLLSPASRWVTGTVQVVDGGYLAR